MARVPRKLVAGVIYHLLNRAVQSQQLFAKEEDYVAFEKIISEAVDHVRLKHKGKIFIYSYCLMPNHWHMVASANQDQGISHFIKWLTATHAQRARLHRKDEGRGHLYQDRYKSFPVQNDRHFLTLLRYVEANPKRAGLVDRAEEWAWSSLTPGSHPVISEWPLPKGKDWVALVNDVVRKTDSEQIKHSLLRGSPYGSSQWAQDVAPALGLQQTLKPLGRPNKGV